MNIERFETGNQIFIQCFRFSQNPQMPGGTKPRFQKETTDHREQRENIRPAQGPRHPSPRHRAPQPEHAPRAPRAGLRRRGRGLSRGPQSDRACALCVADSRAGDRPAPLSLRRRAGSSPTGGPVTSSHSDHSAPWPCVTWLSALCPVASGEGPSAGRVERVPGRESLCRRRPGPSDPRRAQFLAHRLGLRQWGSWGQHGAPLALSGL